MKTVQEVIAAYRAHLDVRVRSGDLGDGTLRHRELQEFARQFGHQTLDQCRRHDLTEFLAAHPQWKSGWTQERAIADVLRCFRWAEDEELIAHSPYRKPRSMRFRRRPRQPMTAAQYVAIMRAAMHEPYTGPRAGQPSYHRRLPKRASARALRRALFFLRRTGARTGEMRGLTWGDVDLAAGIIRLVEHKTAAATGEDRLIGLDPATLRFLRNLQRQRSRLVQGRIEPPAAGEHVFLNGRGRKQQGPWKRQSFARLLRKYAVIAGVPLGVSAYGLRHLFTITGIMNGVGERQIADQLGHTTTKYVAWYGKQSRSQAEHLRNVVAQVLYRPRPGNGGDA